MPRRLQERPCRIDINMKAMIYFCKDYLMMMRLGYTKYYSHRLSPCLWSLKNPIVSQFFFFFFFFFPDLNSNGRTQVYTSLRAIYLTITITTTAQTHTQISTMEETSNSTYQAIINPHHNSAPRPAPAAHLIRKSDT